MQIIQSKKVIDYFVGHVHVSVKTSLCFVDLKLAV